MKKMNSVSSQTHSDLRGFAADGSEGVAPLPPAAFAAAALRRAAEEAAPQQPRLYADLLAEADRRRRAADAIVVRGMLAPRDPRP